MKENLKKLISIVLVCTLTFLLSSSVIAIDNRSASFITDYNKAQIAKDIYAALSDEAKLIFNQSIASNPELSDFHKKYVDPSFEMPAVQYSTTSSTLSVLTQQLNQLQLPPDVLYALQALASSIIAAIADGPLPIGEIMLAVAAVDLLIVVAANWTSIASDWDSIVEAFVEAFPSMQSDLEEAFDAVDAEVPNVQEACDAIPLGRNARIDGRTFNGTVTISDIEYGDLDPNSYYVAVLDKATNDVWVDILEPINHGYARYILSANSGQVGIFAPSKTKARGLAQPGAIGPENHGTTQNYYEHFHNPLFRHAHIWFFEYILA